MIHYSVIVSNLGTVHTTSKEHEARKEFNDYVTLSKQGYGRVGHESITLMEDGEIIKEYLPKNKVND